MSTDTKRAVEVRTGGGHHVVVHHVDHLEAGRLARLVGDRERDRQTGIADEEVDAHEDHAGLDPSDLEPAGWRCGPSGCRRVYRTADRPSSQVGR